MLPPLGRTGTGKTGSDVVTRVSIKAPGRSKTYYGRRVEVVWRNGLRQKACQKPANEAPPLQSCDCMDVALHLVHCVQCPNNALQDLFFYFFFF